MCVLQRYIGRAFTFTVATWQRRPGGGRWRCPSSSSGRSCSAGSRCGCRWRAHHHRASLHHIHTSAACTQERRAEQDRASAQAALGSAAEGEGGTERMLGKITEQITERLQVEMRRETANQMKEGEVGARVRPASATNTLGTRAELPARRLLRSRRCSTSTSPRTPAQSATSSWRARSTAPSCSSRAATPSATRASRRTWASRRRAGARARSAESLSRRRRRTSLSSRCRAQVLSLWPPLV